MRTNEKLIGPDLQGFNETEVLDRVKPSSVIAYSRGYADGLKEGRRLERRANRKMVRAAMSKQGHTYCSRCWYLGEIILEQLTAQRAKRLEGK